ncbi:MAG TPA: alkaline phosphatase family protein, partial [Candidatus Acidoferrales bacterium]|nr:alkaline phosphatase family protein [Candidatus Acidoferrales bacterium]
MKRLAAINVVGLTEALIGEYTPRIAEFMKRGALSRIAPAFPAVTCTAQTNYLTGATPAQHGIVGNGWHNRELAETHFWKQSNRVVQAPKIWDDLRTHVPNFTAANCFWWYNMYSSVDYSITPRPMYPADGRKFFDVYSWPYSIREDIKTDLGEFPFFGFWGPAAGIKSPQGAADCATRWIAESAKWIENKYSPTLNLVYLPHLDYNLQRHGVYSFGYGYPQRSSPIDPKYKDAIISDKVPLLDPAIHPDLRAIDAIVGDLIEHFGKRGVQVVLLSEYGITNVDTPVHLNRLFRQQGWLMVKDELGLEILDAGASKVFAVADHQVAHIYLNDRSLESKVRDMLEKQVPVDLTVLG